jgi:hypothetical protein
VINCVVTRWTRRHLGVRLTLHKLRHAYGKHRVDRGVDIRIIAEALGHESLESTKIYTQVSFERTRRIAELSALPGNQITMNGESSYGWPGRGWHRTPPPSARAQWAPFGLLPETKAPAGAERVTGPRASGARR